MRSLLQVFKEAGQNFSSLLRHAPSIALLAFAGELLQHIAEVQLGMFASKAAFIALQNTSGRMFFGVFKIAAVLTAAMWAARWLAVRSGKAGSVDWPRLVLPSIPVLIALVAIMLSALEFKIRIGAMLAVTIIAIPVSYMAMDALFGNPRLGWRDTLKLRPQPPLSEFSLIVPLALLVYSHFANHSLAYGAASALVWALMVWDSALVAMLALWMGVITWRGYRPLLPA